MILGIGSYTFGWAVGVPGNLPARPMNEMDLLRFATANGIKLIQIGDNLPLHAFPPERLDNFGSSAQSLGIELQAGTRRLTPENVDCYVSIARKLNSKLIRFVIDDRDYHPTPASVTSILKDCAPLLGGLTLAIENHDRFPAKMLREMIERAGDERIGVCLDTANSLGAGEGLATVLEVLAPFTRNLHLKDFSVKRVPSMMGFTVSGAPAGEGLMNVPCIMAQLAPFPKCDTAILEQWVTPAESIEATVAREKAWASQSLDFLKPFFK